MLNIVVTIESVLRKLAPSLLDIKVAIRYHIDELALLTLFDHKILCMDPRWPTNRRRL